MRLALLVLLAGCVEYDVKPDEGGTGRAPDTDDTDDAEGDDGLPDGIEVGGVTGTICATEDVGLAGADVALEHAYGVARTVTDADGTYLLTDIPAGTWTLSVVHEDFLTHFDVAIPPNEIVEVASDECIGCDIEVPCVGLAEAIDRGAIRIEMGSGGNIDFHALSDDIELCMEEWSIITSDESQDAAIGPYELEHLVKPEIGVFPYGFDVFDGVGDQAWWCVERYQSTSRYGLYDYNGSLAPDMLFHWIADRTDADASGVEDHQEIVEVGDEAGSLRTQVNLWNTEKDQPIVLVGRARSLVTFEEPTDEHRVTVEAFNLGQQPATATVSEVVPPGFAVTDVDPPGTVTTRSDGATVLSWEVELEAALPVLGGPAVYDLVELSYVLGVGESTCVGRCEGNGVTGRWLDRDASAQVSHSEPLILEVCPAEE